MSNTGGPWYPRNCICEFTYSRMPYKIDLKGQIVSLSDISVFAVQTSPTYLPTIMRLNCTWKLWEKTVNLNHLFNNVDCHWFNSFLQPTPPFRVHCLEGGGRRGGILVGCNGKITRGLRQMTFNISFESINKIIFFLDLSWSAQIN